MARVNMVEELDVFTIDPATAKDLDDGLSLRWFASEKEVDTWWEGKRLGSRSYG